MDSLVLINLSAIDNLNYVREKNWIGTKNMHVQGTC